MIIFGRKVVHELLDAFHAPCPNCEQTTIFEVLCKKSVFTLFFISLFAYRRQHLIHCRNCGIGREITHQEAERLQTRISELGAEPTEEEATAFLERFYDVLLPEEVRQIEGVRG